MSKGTHPKSKNDAICKRSSVLPPIATKAKVVGKDSRSVKSPLDKATPLFPKIRHNIRKESVGHRIAVDVNADNPIHHRVARVTQPPEKTQSSHELLAFLKSAFNSEIIVDEEIRRTKCKKDTMWVRAAKFPDNLDTLSTSLPYLLQRRYGGLDGPKRVRLLVKLIHKVMPGSGNDTDILVEKAREMLPVLASIMITSTINTDEEGEDYVNESAEVLLTCLSGCRESEGFKVVTSDMWSNLICTCDTATSTELLRQLLKVTSQKLRDVSRYNRLHWQPELKALEVIFSSWHLVDPFAALLMEEIMGSNGMCGGYFQGTGLGSLLSISTTPVLGEEFGSLELPYKVTRTITSMRGWPDVPSAAIENKINVILAAVRRIRDAVKAGLASLLYSGYKRHHQAAILWMNEVIGLNQPRSSTSDPLSLHQDLVCSDGFMLNFAAIVLELFELVYTDETTLEMINLELFNSPECPLDYNYELCLTGGLIKRDKNEEGNSSTDADQENDTKETGQTDPENDSGNQERGKAKPKTEDDNTNSNESPPQEQGQKTLGKNPPAHDAEEKEASAADNAENNEDEKEELSEHANKLFFLCHGAVTVSVLPSLLARYNAMLQLQSDLQEAESSQNSVGKQEVESTMKLLGFVYNPLLVESGLFRRVTEFHLAQCKLFLKMLDTTGPDGSEVDKEAQVKAFSQIPQSAVRDLMRWFFCVSTLKPEIDKDVLQDLSFAPYADFCVGLLLRPYILRGAETSFMVIQAVQGFIETEIEQLQEWKKSSLTMAKHQLVPVVLRTYIRVDAVEGFNIEEDTFDEHKARSDICDIILTIWKDPVSQEAVLQQRDTDLFNKFLHAILDTVMYTQRESLATLSYAKDLEDELQRWPATSYRARAQRQRIENMVNVSARQTAYLLSNLHLLHELIIHTKVAALFAQPPLSQRLASAMHFLLETMEDDKLMCLDFDDPKTHMKPTETHKKVGNIVLSVCANDPGGRDGFIACFVAETDLDLDVLRRACQAAELEGQPKEERMVHLNALLASAQEELRTELEERQKNKEKNESWVDKYLEATVDEDAIARAYQEQLGEFRFFSADLLPNFSFLACLQETSPATTKGKVLMKEMRQLRENLPLHPRASIFVVQDNSRLDVMRCLVSGPADTPYSRGLFAFDVFFPDSYPSVPPLVRFLTTGLGTVTFNPNLYPSGKICLSLLGTWYGKDVGEKWDPTNSSLYQILLSIQSLILTSDPYFNEPGYENYRGTEEGEDSSREFNRSVYSSTLRYAMLDQVRNPTPGFEKVIRLHFAIQRDIILKECAAALSNCTVDRDRLMSDGISLYQELQNLSAAATPGDSQGEAESKN